MKKLWWYNILFLVAILFTVDRALKYFALKLLSSSESFFVTQNLGIQLFRNDKFAGRILLPNFMATGIIAIFFIFILSLLLKELRGGKRKEVVALTVVLTGAVSNALDRLVYKTVIDFFVLGPWVINLADIFIIIGVLLYLQPRQVRIPNKYSITKS